MLDPLQGSIEVTVNGTPLTYLAYWGDLTITWRYPVGSWEASWSMDIPVNYLHPDIVRGARVVIWVGPTPIWRGKLTEINKDAQSFTATGAGREAETALCMGFGGTLTTTPSTAVSWGIQRGALTWSGINSLPSTSVAATEETVTFNYISDLLNAAALRDQVNWLVDPAGFVQYAAAPTTSTLFVDVGVGELGLVDEEYVSDLFGRYLTTSGVIASVEAHDNTQNVDRVERGVDLTGRGPMTLAQAQAVLDGILAKGKARTGFTSGIELAEGQVCNTGGTPFALSELGRLVGLGARARLLGLFDLRGLATSTDVIVAEGIWRVDDGLMTLNPAGLAARDLASIVEDAGGVLL